MPCTMPTRARVAGWASGLSLLALSACGSLPGSPPSASPDSASAPFASAAASTAASACTPASAQPAQPAWRAETQLSLQGQIGLKLAAWRDQPAKGVSLGFFFAGQAEQGKLDLMTPLGSQLAQVSWSPMGATLRRHSDSESEQLLYGSIDELATRVLGEAIPLPTLVHWMQGRPDPHRPHRASTTPGRFEQDGWQVDVSDFAQHRVQIQREPTPSLRGVQIKVYLDH